MKLTRKQGLEKLHKLDVVLSRLALKWNQPIYVYQKWDCPIDYTINTQELDLANYWLGVIYPGDSDIHYGNYSTEGRLALAMQYGIEAI